MKLWAGLLFFLGLLLVSKPSVAYDTDGHFYTVYVIAMDSGFTRAEALEIATMVEYTDWDSRTDAIQWPTGTGNEQRRRYHFPCNSAYDAAWTEQNSAWAKHNVNMALKANNRTKLGIAIHVYQDSYSHEAYGQVKGHLLAWPTVHHPDYPYRWTDKYVNMTNFVYTIMEQYRANNNLEPFKRKLLDVFYQKAGSFTPDWWWLHPGGWTEIQNKDYTMFNLQPRIDSWKLKIAETYKDVELPVYKTPPQSILDEFTRVITAYNLPDKESDCDKSQWAKKDATLSAPAALSVIPADSTATNEAEVARILEMPIKWGARRLVTQTTQVGSDSRIQSHLANEAALGVILDSAELVENPTFIAYIVNYWDWTKVNVAAQLELRLGATNFRVRMLCAGFLSSAPLLSDIASEKLRATYKAVVIRNLTPSERSYLLDLIPTDPEKISTYAPTAVAILQGLMKYSDTLTGATAKLYLITVDTDRQAQATPLDSIRMDAFNTLQGQEAKNAANGSRYWIIRSYEDFDGALSNSQNDRDRLAGLLKIWTWASAANDIEALRAAAVAISTYDRKDGVPNALIDALQNTLAVSELAGSTLADIAMDSRNALQAITR